jgi:hypothetical protein
MMTQTGFSPQQIRLLKTALQYLAGQNGHLATYAQRLKEQVEIVQAEAGGTIPQAEWVRMAKILSIQAIDSDIGAKRIAERIYPLVDGSWQYANKLAYIPASFAVNQLLALANVEVSQQVRTLLTDVVKELQKMIAQP